MSSIRRSGHPLFVVLLALLLALAPFVHTHRGDSVQHGWHLHFGHLHVGATHFDANEADLVTLGTACADTRERAVSQDSIQLPELAPPPPLRLLPPRAVALPAPTPPPAALAWHRASGLPPPAAAPPTTA